MRLRAPGLTQMRPPNPVAIALIATMATLAVASAADIPTTARLLAAGTAGVSACDPDGFSLLYTVDTTGHVTSVAVGSIAAACAGGTLRVTLANGTASVGQGSTALPSAGFTGSVTVAISPTPLSSGVTATYIVVEGP